MKKPTCLDCTNEDCEMFEALYDVVQSVWIKYSHSLRTRTTFIGHILAPHCTLYELRPSLAEGGGTSPGTLCSCGKTKERIAWRCDECDAADPKCGCGLSLVNGKCPSCRGRTS